jgi:hypothetical protein
MRLPSPARSRASLPSAALLVLLGACSENEIVSKPEAPDGDTATGGPDIVVTPEAVDFGTLAWNGEGVATITIGNVGTAPLHIEGLSLGSGSTDVSWTALSSPVVPAGGQVETVLTWSPSGPGPLTERLLVTSDDADEAEVPVALSGGVPYGEILVEPAVYDFGTLEVGASATTTVTVSNVGEGLLTVTDWTYAATDGDMVVLDAGDITTTPAVLAPGDTTEVLVQYTPSASGGDEGTLAITSDDPVRPSTGAQQLGNGAEPDPCDGFYQSVELFLTADDTWQGWLDGTEFTAPGQNAWNTFDTLAWELPCGDHALSLYATDTGQVISGVIAVVKVEGAVRFVSGPDNWTMTEAAPPSDWTDAAYDDSAWHIPEVCANTSVWGTTPQPFYDLGAQWIWWATDCTGLGEAWLRLNFTVP